MLSRVRTLLSASGSTKIFHELPLRLEELLDVSVSCKADPCTHLDISTIIDDLLILLERLVVGTVERGEPPLLGDDDLLSSGELVSGAAESLDDDGFVGVFASDGHDHLATAQILAGKPQGRHRNVHIDTGDGTVRLPPSSAHTLLEPTHQLDRFKADSPIGPGTGQHLVDPDDMVWVNPHSEMESLLARSLDNVLVCANSSGFESF